MRADLKSAVALSLLLALVAGAPPALARRGAKPKAKQAQDGPAKSEGPVRAEVLDWLVAHNEGLQPDFLQKDPPDRVVRIPDGREVPIYHLKQFLDVNFRLTLHARIQEKGSDIVPVMEEHMR